MDADGRGDAHGDGSRKALLAWGRLHEALRAYRAAYREGAASPETATSLAWLEYALGSKSSAFEIVDAALKNAPESADLWYIRGKLHQSVGQSPQATQAYERCLEIDPRHGTAADALWSHHFDEHDYAGAEQWVRHALDVQPTFTRHANLVTTLLFQCRRDEALAQLQRFSGHDADIASDTDDLFACGTAWVWAGRPAQAAQLYRRGLALFPSVESHGQYALALLTLGTYPEGWRQYEHRWMLGHFVSTRAPDGRPAWRGEDLRGKTILLRREQGAGDTFQFARFARQLQSRGATVVLLVPDNLKRIASCVDGVDRVVTSEAGVRFDYYAYLMSLPQALETTLDEVGDGVPYVQPEASRVAAWRERLRGSSFKVGVTWVGNPAHVRDRFRSIALAQLAQILKTPGVQFFSLQTPLDAKDADELKGFSNVVELGRRLHDFHDTAAVIANLDLVICIDSGVAHLAGAIGRPTWVLLPEVGDFRWMHDRNDTPWYPTMRLFRQQHLGDWSGVVAEVSRRLGQVARGEAPAIFQANAHASAERSADGMLLEVDAPPNIARAIETRHGILQVVPGASLAEESLLAYGEHLEGEVEVIRRLILPGAVIVEAAAGVGAHTLPLAQIAGAEGHLIASEPKRETRARLRQNLDANGVGARITVLRGSLGEPRPEQDDRADLVDDLRLERLDLLKVSVATAAESVLAGATSTIERLRPIVMVAVSSSEQAASVCAGLGLRRYRAGLLTTATYSPDVFSQTARVETLPASAAALLAIPDELVVTHPIPGLEPVEVDAGIAATEVEQPRKKGLMGWFSRDASPRGDRGRAERERDRRHQDLVSRGEQAVALSQLGRHWEARRAGEAAARDGLRDRALFVALGESSFRCGLVEDSEGWMRKALAIASDTAALSGLARGLQAQGRLVEAADAFRGAMRSAPGDAEASRQAASFFLVIGDASSAKAIARPFLSEDGHAWAWDVVGSASVIEGDRGEDLDAFRKSVEIADAADPSSDAFVHLATALAHAGRSDDAIALLRRKLPTHPDCAGYVALGIEWLRCGDFERGARAYEMRWGLPQFARSRPAEGRPVWRDQPLTGKVVLLHDGESLTDTIQFVRCAAVLKRKGAHVVLRAQRELVELMKGAAGIDRVLHAEEPPPAFDYVASPSSLSLRMMSTGDLQPSDLPYLAADPGRRSLWAQRLSTLTGVRIGIAWARDAGSSIPQDLLLSIFERFPASFVSLQRRALAGGIDDTMLPADVLDAAFDLRDFADVAALIDNLDLVITVDNVLPHIAGALGKEVWVLLPKVADFHWPASGDASPWYPSGRLFRQPATGDWASIVETVLAELPSFTPDAGRLLQPPAAGSPTRDAGEDSDWMTGIYSTKVGWLQCLPEPRSLRSSFERYGEWRAMELDFIASLVPQGATVVDVSPGVGAHAIGLARVVGGQGHLVAFERRHLERAVLRHNVEMSGLGNVTVLDQDLAGEAKLDELHLAEMSLLYVEEESIAPSVLDGAVSLIWERRPRIFVTMADGTHTGAIIDKLRELGYRVFTVTTPSVGPTNFNRATVDPAEGHAARALVGVPEELPEIDLRGVCEEIPPSTAG